MTVFVKIEAEIIFEPCLLTAGRQAQLTSVNSSTVDKNRARIKKLLTTMSLAKTDFSV